MKLKANCKEVRTHSEVIEFYRVHVLIDCSVQFLYMEHRNEEGIRLESTRQDTYEYHRFNLSFFVKFPVLSTKQLYQMMPIIAKGILSGNGESDNINELAVVSMLF